MSFARKLASISEASRILIDTEMEHKKAKDMIFLKRQEEQYDALMHFLTKKYAKRTQDSLIRAAQKGKSEAYINFDRNDFKVNFPGLGDPKKNQRNWLNEMKNPDSKYVIQNAGNIILDGISADIWNNGAFTTRFSWRAFEIRG